MKARHGLIVMAVLGAMLAPCAAAPAQDIAPAAFIGAFYRDYFADPAAARKRHVDSGLFYSSGLRRLMDANRAACAKTGRQDSKCGWNVDGDEFLHAQEFDPALTLASSGFTASAAGANAVDVRFRLFPNEPDTQRAMRYVLVRENGQWRVDDVRDGENGKNSLRQLIAAESSYADASARDVAEAARWVNIYIQSESVEPFARFAAFPLTVCDTRAGCVPYQERDARLPLLVRTLYLSYFDKGVLPLPVPRGAAREGKVARSGPFDYTFRQGQWWLSRVDMRRAPVRQK
ncbi:DUF3828 domain-containing protein [Massilia sp. CCM 8733]|uniref:DUF3828 domain-containing protein n=1 Tax=Massilia mucilaginosa TaxID=2609282 RepID=A0ABX0NLB7_9BURK|nr:DUF3828 domain-containing protein [Massilia mucilaginosa]NHZ87601.1 DUF3828 domain-containing protein [Massilia mucilaginosa]